MEDAEWMTKNAVGFMTHIFLLISFVSDTSADTSDGHLFDRDNKAPKPLWLFKSSYIVLREQYLEIFV